MDRSNDRHGANRSRLAPQAVSLIEYRLRPADIRRVLGRPGVDPPASLVGPGGEVDRLRHGGKMVTECRAVGVEQRIARSDPDGIGQADLVGQQSIVGVGMRSHTGVAETMFRALSEKGINIQVISTSEIKISVLIDEAYTELAVRALHAAYGLDKIGV